MDPHKIELVSSLSQIMEEPIGPYPSLLKHLILMDSEGDVVIVFS